MITTPKNNYLETPDAAQATACLEFIADALRCALRRANRANDQEAAHRIQNAISSVTASRRAVYELNPEGWDHLVRARAAQRAADRESFRATPIDNMGVPNDQRGKNGS